jgi:hypothetical protein
METATARSQAPGHAPGECDQPGIAAGYPKNYWPGPPASAAAGRGLATSQQVAAPPMAPLTPSPVHPGPCLAVSPRPQAISRPQPHPPGPEPPAVSFTTGGPSL